MYHTWTPQAKDWDLAQQFLDWMARRNAGRKGRDRAALTCRQGMESKYQRVVTRTDKRYSLTASGWREWRPKGEPRSTKFMQGRPPGSDWYLEEVITPAFTTPAPLCLFPGTFGLCVIDVDSRTFSAFRRWWPPGFFLHSASCFKSDISSPELRNKGHAFYRALQDYSGVTVKKFLDAFTPSNQDPLSLLGSGMTASIGSETHRFDYCQHNRPIFIPPHQFRSFFESMIDLTADELPCFPYSLIALQATLGHTHSVLLQGTLAEHVNSRGGISSASADTWREVIIAIGYDRSFEDLTSGLRAKTAGAAHTQTEVGYSASYSLAGVRHIVETEGWRLRFSDRAQTAEILMTGDLEPPSAHLAVLSMLRRKTNLELLVGDYDPNWSLITREGVGETLRHRLRSKYTVSTSRDEQEYEPLRKWDLFVEWMGDVARETGGHHNPFMETIKSWAAIENPLPEDESFILCMLGLPTCMPERLTEGLRRALVRIETHWLFAYLWRIAHPSNQEYRCPYLPVFVGPTGVGKSRFLEYLGFLHYHSSSARLNDPPKEFGEKVQESAVIELRELHEQLTGRTRAETTMLRGRAKEHIERTRIEFRAAHAPGSRAGTYYLSGILGGTSQAAVRVPSTDGLARRLFQFPVRRHAEILPDFSNWDARWLEYFPRAMKRTLDRGDPGELTANEDKIGRLCLRWQEEIELTGEKTEEPDQGWRAQTSEFDDGLDL